MTDLPKICPFCEHVIDHCVVELCVKHAGMRPANEDDLPKICPFCEHVIDHCVVELCKQHAGMNPANKDDLPKICPFCEHVIDHCVVELCAKHAGSTAAPSTRTAWVEVSPGYWEREVHGFTLHAFKRCDEGFRWEVTYNGSNQVAEWCASIDVAKSTADVWIAETVTALLRDEG